MLLSLAFGICPPQSSLQLALAFLAVDLHFEQLPKEPPRQSMPSSQLVQGDHRPPKSPMRHPQRHRRDRPAHHLLAQAAAESLRHGSLRRLPIHAHAADSCYLAASRRPAGNASPGSSRVADLPALFHAGSSMGTLPSEASPRSSPPDPLRSDRPPCRFPPCDVAASRI